jgi:hypothetical protein
MKNTRKWTYLPIKDLLEPNDRDIVFKDYWWIVSPDNEISIYGGGTPQANKNKKIVDRLTKDKVKQGYKVEFHPLLYLKPEYVGY